MLYHLLARDIIEIIFYSSCIFGICQWLKADKTKNLLFYFLAYCIVALGAWAAQLPTLSSFLFTYAPVTLILFIIFHEKTLQRNLVTLCSITPASFDHDNWLNTLLSSCLTLLNNDKSVTVIIEHTNSLHNFLIAPFIINANIEKNVLDIFFTSTSYEEQKMVWVNTSGKIQSINVVWNNHNATTENDLFYTLASDAIIFSTHPTTRTFTLIIQGQKIHHLSAHHIYQMIKKQLSSNQSSFFKKPPSKQKELLN